MSWRPVAAYVAGTVDRELLLRNAYLATENRIVRQQIQGRLHLKRLGGLLKYDERDAGEVV